LVRETSIKSLHILFQAGPGQQPEPARRGEVVVTEEKEGFYERSRGGMGATTPFTHHRLAYGQIGKVSVKDAQTTAKIQGFREKGRKNQRRGVVSAVVIVTFPLERRN